MKQMTDFTQSVMRQIIEAREKCLNEAVILQLVHIGRILPGEAFARIAIDLGDLFYEDIQYHFHESPPQ